MEHRSPSVLSSSK
jgi:hypothetical protein